MVRRKKNNRTVANRHRNRQTSEVSRQDRSDISVAKTLDPAQEAARIKYFQLAVGVVLLAFGVYYAKTLFGYIAVPNSDWPAFIAKAKEILNFKVPNNFKRLPLFGMLHIFISNFVGGNHPLLTAAWMLNAILAVLTVILIWRIARQIIGESAIWLSILIVVNPWVIKSQTDPLVEISMIAFSVMTFFFMFRNSNWCYVMAMLASMIRYECTALIGVCFLWDMVHCKTMKRRMLALLWSVLAFLPMGAWLVGTKLAWKGGGHYVGHFTSDRHLGMEYVRYLWETSFRYLLELPAAVKVLFVKVSSQGQADSIKSSVGILYGFSKAVAGISFVAGVIYGVIKRQWKYLALLLFFLVYIGIHMIRHKTHHRYCVPVVWLCIILCAYGLMCIWKMVNFRKAIPRVAVIILQIAVFVCATVWLVMLMRYLPEIKPFCTKGAYLPFAAMAAVIAVGVLRLVFFRAKYIWRDLALSAVICLMVVSSHFMTARIIGNGSHDREFKMLADWYVENTSGDEKLLTTMPHVVSTFAPKYKKYFRHTGSFKKLADANEFIEQCYKQKIIYIAWDSRLGLVPHDSYYKQWKLGKMAPLMQTRDVGPFEFMTQLKVSERRYINIFRLRAMPEGSTDKPN
ncbi:MAG TPA: hypothetical protein ENH94_08835 [Phycisphaerales bacterium]|nr:hypothetical protein [Phycisphaerales bacterium]